MLYPKVLELAYHHPELRRTLQPLLHKYGSVSLVTVFGSERQAYLDTIWDMYVKTYQAIGLIVNNPTDLLGEFPQWELYLDGDGNPHAFGLNKPTPFGIKSGLSGHDGTPDGKAAAVNGIRTKFKRQGHYGEVSHKVLEIALAANAPVVCAFYAPQVLGKPVQPQPDGLHYKRTLAGVGTVSKVLIGNPRGIPTTHFDKPSCPVSNSVLASQENQDYYPDDASDIAAHLACLV